MFNKFNERTSGYLTNLGGSMQFFWSIIISYGCWIVYNSLVPTSMRFDGQWFPLLLFISNLIQLMFMPLLQVGQNITNKKAEERAVLQLELIKKIEELTIKIETILETQIIVQENIVAELHGVHEDLHNELINNYNLILDKKSE